MLGMIIMQANISWLMILGATIGMSFCVYLFNNPALALAIQCCGFYIVLFALDFLGIDTSSAITAGFHIVLASCYLSNIVRAKFVAKSFLNPTTVAFIFMLIWFGLNWYFYARGSSLGTSKLGFMFTMMIPSFIGIQLLDLEQIKQFRSYSIFLGITGLILAVLAMAVIGNTTDEFGRFRVTPSANPLTFAYPLGIGALFMFSLAMERTVKYKLVAALMLASTFFFMLSTGSRGPLLALFISIFMVLWWVGVKKWIRFAPISIMIITLVSFSLMSFIPDSALERIYLVGDFLSGSTTATANAVSNDRLRLWQTSIDIWLRYPITGIGIGNMGLYIGKQSEFSHNFVLELLSETGGLGLLLFLNALGGVAIAFRQVRRMKHTVGVTSAIIGLFVFSFINLSLSGQLTTAIPFWIAIGGITRLGILGKQKEITSIRHPVNTELSASTHDTPTLVTAQG